MNGSTAQRRPVVTAIGRVLVAVLAFNALSPLSALAQEKGTVSPLAQVQIRQLAALQADIEKARLEKARSPAERVDEELRQAQDLLDLLRNDARARGAVPAPASRASGPAPRGVDDARRNEHRRDLRERLAAARSGQLEVQAEFGRVGRELTTRKLPAEIRARHEQAERDFEARKAEFDHLAEAWQTDPSDARLAALADFFDRHPAKRRQPMRDPRKLPWATPGATPRVPADTQAAWFRNLWGGQATRLAQAGGVGGLSFDIPPEPGTAPVEADLAETPETRRTAGIAAKAAELGHNALAIHNWVRNTIEFVPTWGAVQAAQDTLDKRRGNAHDIASLEIALLRAARIPARYRYGTIELPAEQVQNWVGGAENASAAQQVLGQGGIANTALVGNGRVMALRLEHVWVDAYVNWAPSRGARQGRADQHVNPVGPHNAWVGLDASFKQYDYTAGVDLGTAVPLDADAVLAAARQGATVNAAEGWVQNLDQAAVQAQVADYRNRLQAYVDARFPNPTLGDLAGRKIIAEQAPTLLAASLPYRVAQSGQQVAAVPDSLQHRFRYLVYASEFDRMLDSPALQYTARVSQLAGKRISIAYAPASQADLDTLAAYLPRGHADGSPVSTTEFPSSLPAYLIRLRPQIVVDGQVVASATGSFVMGTDLPAQGGFTQFGQIGQWDMTDDDSNVVGNTTIIGINAQGISAAQLGLLRQRIDATRAQVDARNGSGLTGERLVGDLLTAAMWTWFVEADGHHRLNQRQSGMIENPGLSYGLMHVLASPAYSWGVIRSVSFPGVNFDIGHVRTLGWSKKNLAADWVRYNRARGQYMSALEHDVPARHFADPQACNPPGRTPVAGLPACPQGLSAVRALEIAATQGQRIYTITPAVYQANPGIVQSQLVAHSADTRSAVQNHLDAGHEVTIHQSPVVSDGWRGAGYLAIDPDTGAGGYLIEGGANGGYYSLVANGAASLSILSLLIGKLVFAGLIPALSIAAPFYALAFAVMALTAVAIAVYEGGFDFHCGGIPTCGSPEAILKIAAGAIALVLLSAGLSGNIIALALAILLLKQIFTRGGP